MQPISSLHHLLEMKNSWASSPRSVTWQKFCSWIHQGPEEFAPLFENKWLPLRAARRSVHLSCSNFKGSPHFCCQRPGLLGPPPIASAWKHSSSPQTQPFSCLQGTPTPLHRGYNSIPLLRCKCELVPGSRSVCFRYTGIFQLLRICLRKQTWHKKRVHSAKVLYLQFQLVINIYNQIPTYQIPTEKKGSFFNWNTDIYIVLIKGLCWPFPSMLYVHF